MLIQVGRRLLDSAPAGFIAPVAGAGQALVQDTEKQRFGSQRQLARSRTQLMQPVQ